MTVRCVSRWVGPSLGGLPPRHRNQCQYAHGGDPQDDPGRDLHPGGTGQSAVGANLVERIDLGVAVAAAVRFAPPRGAPTASGLPELFDSWMRHGSGPGRKQGQKFLYTSLAHKSPARSYPMQDRSASTAGQREALAAVMSQRILKAYLTVSDTSMGLRCAVRAQLLSLH